MNILSIPKMILTPRSNWLDLETIPPSLAKLFLLLVLPFSALPPLLLNYAGKHYGDAFVYGFAGKPWGTIASVFFLAEMLIFLGISWFIEQVAAVAASCRLIYLGLFKSYNACASRYPTEPQNPPES